MVTKILKWGNSLGLRIPKSFAKDLGIEPSAKVDISIENGRLVVQPLRGPRYELETLLSGVTRDNRHDAIDLGDPVGRESL